LGTFEIKKPSLIKELGKCKARLETCKKNTRVHIEYRKDLTEQIDKLSKLKDKVTKDFKELLEWEKLKASRKLRE
jgi:hypothetical protein